MLLEQLRNRNRLQLRSNRLIGIRNLQTGHEFEHPDHAVGFQGSIRYQHRSKRRLNRKRQQLRKDLQHRIRQQLRNRQQHRSQRRNLQEQR